MIEPPGSLERMPGGFSLWKKIENRRTLNIQSGASSGTPVADRRFSCGGAGRVKSEVG